MELYHHSPVGVHGVHRDNLIPGPCLSYHFYPILISTLRKQCSGGPTFLLSLLERYIRSHLRAPASVPPAKESQCPLNYLLSINAVQLVYLFIYIDIINFNFTCRLFYIFKCLCHYNISLMFLVFYVAILSMGNAFCF